MILKISALSSGAVLLDGEPIELDRLDEKLQSAKENNGVILYYRETPEAEPPPQAMSVLQMIVKHNLPVSLSSKPDFSNYVDTQGVAHPRTDPSEPPPPAVVVRDDIEQVFAEARSMAIGEKGERGLVIVRPDRKYLVLPPLAKSPALEAQAASLAGMIPTAVKRNIAVIGDTSFAAGSGTPDIVAANKSIPFFGTLMGFTYIGHAVWIFEGDISARVAGCRSADVLMVDSGMLPFLKPGWDAPIAEVMRNANILIHDRKTFQLRVVRKMGKTNQLEFPVG